MKKYIILAAFAAALAFSSCNKVDPKEEPKNDEQVALRTVNFCARPTETKTVFGSKNGTKYPVLWQEGDKVCPSLNFAAPSSDNYITVTPENGGTSASFSGPVADAESYQFIFVSPAATFKSINKTNQTVMVEFPSGQTSTAASPDPAAQILFADTGELNPLPSQVDLEFGHLSAYLHLKFANVDLGTATVQAVNITSEDNTIAGRVFYHLDTETFEPSTNFHTIAVATTTLEDVWCGLCPGDFSGKQLTIEVSTDQGTFTKTLTMPASAILPSGKIAKFTVDMTGVSLVAPVVYKAITSANQLNVGDKVIIAAAGEDQAFAMSTGQNTNNRSAAGVTKTAEEITNPTDAVEIFELEDGVVPGHYAFKATRTSGYIYAGNQASSGSNVLKTNDTKDNSASWAVSVEDVTVGGTTWENATRMFADIPSNGRGLLRFNSNDKLFAAYGNGTTQEAIKVYRLDEPADNTPRFNVTLPNGIVYCSSAAVEVPVYVFGNVAWTASVTGDAVFTSTSTASVSGTGNAILSLSLPALASTEESFVLTISTSESVAEPSFGFTVKHDRPIAVNDILFHEQYWTGSEKNQTLTQYQASGKATTFVYGGAEIVYSQDASSIFLDWPTNGNVFLPSPYEGDLSTTGMEINLRIQKNGGYLKASGIPCNGVKKATLTYKLNRNGTDYTASSDTEGVTVGTLTRTSGTSDWGKAYTEYSYPLTFSEGLSSFNFKITDSHASNHVYIADIKIVVTEIF